MLNSSTLSADIQSDIIVQLDTITTQIPKITDGVSDGTKPVNIFDVDSISNVYGKDTSAIRNLTYPGGDGTDDIYNTKTYAGMEAITEIFAKKISDQVVQHIIADAEVTIRDRLDATNDEQDNLITAFSTFNATIIAALGVFTASVLALSVPGTPPSAITPALGIFITSYTAAVATLNTTLIASQTIRNAVKTQEDLPPKSGHDII